MRIDQTAVIILASGLSSRFENGDKLMADLLGRPVCRHVCDTLGDTPFARKLAITPDAVGARAKVFRRAGCQIVENPSPADGQGAALARAFGALEAAEAVLIVLADMPFVSIAHCSRLAGAIGSSDAAVSVVDGVRTPPVLVSARLFPRLRALTGDQGARAVLADSDKVVEVALSRRQAFDIDTVEDLARAQDLIESAL